MARCGLGSHEPDRSRVSRHRRIAGQQRHAQLANGQGKGKGACHPGQSEVPPAIVPPPPAVMPRPPASTAPGMFAQVAPWRRFRRPGTTGSITGLRENEFGSFVCFVGPSSLAVPASLVAACFPVSFAALLSFCAGGGLAFERPGRKRSPPGSPPPVARARPSRTSRSTQFIAGPARRAPRSPRLFPEFGRRNNRCPSPPSLRGRDRETLIGDLRMPDFAANVFSRVQKGGFLRLRIAEILVFTMR